MKCKWSWRCLCIDKVRFDEHICFNLHYTLNRFGTNGHFYSGHLSPLSKTNLFFIHFAFVLVPFSICPFVFKIFAPVGNSSFVFVAIVPAQLGCVNLRRSQSSQYRARKIVSIYMKTCSPILLPLTQTPLSYI